MNGPMAKGTLLCFQFPPSTLQRRDFSSASESAASIWSTVFSRCFHTLWAGGWEIK